MPLGPDLATAFNYIADQVSNLNQVQYFDRTIKTYSMNLEYGGHKFIFMKLGYSELGTFAGIGYKIKLLVPDGTGTQQDWTIWVKNAVDAVVVNRRVVIAGIYAIINDPNTAKTMWTLDTTQYA